MIQLPISGCTSALSAEPTLYRRPLCREGGLGVSNLEVTGRVPVLFYPAANECRTHFRSRTHCQLI